MRKTLRSKELAMIILRQFHRHMLTVCRRTLTDIHGNIQHSTLHASHHKNSCYRHFKVEGITLAEPMQNRKKSKKNFCCFSIKLYFCTHEREITKSHRSYYTDAPIHHITSHIGSLHPHSLAVQDYPKIFSAINLAGNRKPAMR